MWYKEYKDYPIDKALIRQKVEPSHGIIGCEMHDLNGWGESYHQPLKKKKKGLIATLLELFFSSEKEEKP